MNKPANRHKSLSDVLGASKALPTEPTEMPMEKRPASNSAPNKETLPPAPTTEARSFTAPSAAIASKPKAPTVQSPVSKLEQLNVRIDARLKLEAELIAKRQGRPMTEVVATLLEQWVSAYQATRSD